MGERPRPHILSRVNFPFSFNFLFAVGMFCSMNISIVNSQNTAQKNGDGSSQESHLSVYNCWIAYVWSEFFRKLGQRVRIIRRQLKKTIRITIESMIAVKISNCKLLDMLESYFIASNRPHSSHPDGNSSISYNRSNQLTRDQCSWTRKHINIFGMSYLQYSIIQTMKETIYC